MCQWHSLIRIEIIRTKPYLKAIKRIGITADNEAELFKDLSENPEKGDLIVESGGARVIYHYIKIKDRIYLLGAYPKSEQANLTQAQINELKKAKEILERID